MHLPLGLPEPRPVPPGQYPAWDRALALLNRDLAATLPGVEPLRLFALPADDPNEPEYVFVALSNGEWHGSQLDPDSRATPAAALAAVADAAQETVMELLWQAWPLCPEHGLGMHPETDAEDQVSWWCAGARSRSGSAHVHRAVGELAAVSTPLPPARP